MSRTVRIILFGGIVLAAWCFSSDKLLSRVAHDEAVDDGPSRPDTGESDYQVVKLLSKLFTSIKRNHVEVLNLHRQYARSADPQERAELRARMAERVHFVEGKAREYHQLVPSLTASYPSLKSVIQSFSRDLKAIAGDLDVVKQTDQVVAEAEPAEHRERAPRGIERGIESPMLGAMAVEGRPPESGPEPAEAEKPRERESRGKLIPITLEVRDGDAGVDRRKVIFQLAERSSKVLRGFMDGGSLVPETVAYTDEKGRATVKMQVDPSGGPLRIKRTVMPKRDHVVCRLESVE